MELIPLVPGKPGPGEFSRTAPDTFTTGNTLYYNGNLYAARSINAVYNDYAEFFTTTEDLSEGEALLDTNGVFIGVVSTHYGHCLGTGNAAVALMGRVPIKTNQTFFLGDMIYWDNGYQVAYSYEEYLKNPVGKIVDKVDKDTYTVLVH